MKTISKLALAAMLSTGAAGVVLVPPALAAKKDDKDAGPKLSPAVQKPAALAQQAMQTSDFTTADTQIQAAEAAATTDDEKYVVSALRYDLENKKMAAAQAANPNAPLDQTVLIKPLDALIANPRTAAETRGQLVYRRGLLAFNARQYPNAVQYFGQAKQLGYNDAELDLLIAKAKLETGDASGLTDLNAVVDKQTAAGQKAPEAYYKYGVSRAYAAKDKAATLAWMKKWVAAYPTSKNWRDVVFVYGIQPNPLATLDNPQRIDLFRLLRAAHALADQYDYQEYAQKVFDRGLPAEALTVLKEGFASGKLSAANPSAKALQTQAAAAQKAESSLAVLETKAKASADGKLAGQTADAALGQDNYAKAADLYRIALQKGGVDADQINTRLGISLARSGDKPGAEAAFGAVKGLPRADIAGLWLAWMQNPPA